MLNIATDQLMQIAAAHYTAGRRAEAAETCRQILAQEPEHLWARNMMTTLGGTAAASFTEPATVHSNNRSRANLGLMSESLGRHEEAVEHFRAALAADPNNAQLQLMLGTSLSELKRHEEAATAYRRAAQLSPLDTTAYFNLGQALRLLGRFDEALVAYAEAVRLNPALAEAHYQLGVMLDRAGRREEALAAFRAAIQTRPEMPWPHNGVGVILNRLRRFDEAESALREALRLQPNFPGASINLSHNLSSTGRLDEAIAQLRHALTLSPQDAEVHSTLVYLMHFDPSSDAQSTHRESVAWNDRHAATLKKLWRPHANDRSPERRLRIGYVSPNFAQQAECYFVVPLLEAHDHEHFEIHLYSGVARSDALTERHRKAADQWHEVGKLSDSQLAQKIRADGIDILVDLTMHMASNRALVFAQKPAPVQVAWLAYPGTTGMSAMDYRITDAWMDPEGEDESVYTEKSIRLPDCWCCYHPLADLPAVNDLPALETQQITFGALNSFHKVNEGILALWAKALSVVPQSRLLMLAPEGKARKKVLACMGREGIEARRIGFIDMQPRAEYLKLYQQIDIGLDPLPYNGITTTLDALWMGVPVLSRVGTRASGRAGLAILSTLGYPELAAQSDDEFLNIAARLGDVPRLRELRATLRARMQASPLMDAPRFARGMEEAYRSMWRRWCAEQDRA